MTKTSENVHVPVAQQQPKATNDLDADKASQAQSSVTSHQIAIDGETIAYRATAGWLIVNDIDGQPAAQMGYTSYEREEIPDRSIRPVVFAYNGGPGASSVWLHMGVLGPRRVEVADTNFTLPPPYNLVNNEHSIIDVADLVLIDPVSTGFSKTSW